MKVFCVKEPNLLGTGGSIINAYRKLNKVFFLLNGDTYFDVNLNLLSSKFNSKKYDMMMCCAELGSNISRYSKINLNKLTIKSINKNKKSRYINSGLYIFKKKIFRLKIKKKSLEDTILPKIIERKKAQGFVVKNAKNIFIDIGVPKDFKDHLHF